ncbi:MAG: alpha/beta fold hydrolase [Desulfitobacteriaceae bacterium]|nr:alpha/beta fold hydrolase [Desulfitobacteriaceae bacterium]MDI6879028.1 alpha/beta fold hydrolase [Desulfitobacteriaceae bacterium]MDI6914770.1 alpha/beta fold hydrolase [Desulfitobacteriaceae bacterium]
MNLSPRLAEPFYFSGNSTGLLLIHGFTGSPSEVRFLGERLAEQGFTVSGIRLAGHGTTVEELANKRWQDWIEGAENGSAELRRTCTKVVAIGLSMGGLLSLELAARGLVDGAVAMNAPMVLVDWRTRFLGLAKSFVRYVDKSVEHQAAFAASPEEAMQRFQYTKFPIAALYSLNKAIPRVRKRLGLISCPVLVMQSTKDQTVSPKSARILAEGLSAANPQVVYWGNSGHVLTLGPEREAVALEVTRFVRQVEGLGIEPQI